MFNFFLDRLTRKVYPAIDLNVFKFEKMIPIKTDAARRRFPELNHEMTSEDLTVISDRGAVYFGPKAWLMVLWSLSRYRDWAYRLATPELLPTTRRVVSLISQHRYQISRIAGRPR